MYAIEAYVLSPTSFQGKRVVARLCNRGAGNKPERLTLPWDYALSVGDNYRFAAKSLAARLDLRGCWVEAESDNSTVVFINGTQSYDEFNIA
jgi:hypothetical protein